MRVDDSRLGDVLSVNVGAVRVGARIVKQEEDIFKVCLFRLLLISEIVYVTVVNKFALFSRTAI